MASRPREEDDTDSDSEVEIDDETVQRMALLVPELPDSDTEDEANLNNARENGSMSSFEDSDSDNEYFSNLGGYYNEDYGEDFEEEPEEFTWWERYHCLSNKMQEFITTSEDFTQYVIEEERKDYIFMFLCENSYNRNFPKAHEKIVWMIKNHDIKKKLLGSALAIVCTYSVATSDLETARILLEHGAYVDQPHRAARTPLMLACEAINYLTSDINTVKFLLENGADVNKLDNDNNPIFHYVVRTKNLELIKLILERGADIQRPWGRNKDPMLVKSIIWMNPETLNFFLDLGLDVNSKDKEGYNALIHIMRSGQNAKLVRVLLDRGIDVNAQDKSGNSVLMQIVSEPYYEHIYVPVAKILLEHGVNLKIRNKDGKTAYDLARDKKLFKDYVKDITDVPRFVNDGKDVPDCIVCMNHKIDTLIVTCRHMNCCIDCIENLLNTKNSEGPKCPACRASFVKDDTITVIL